MTTTQQSAFTQDWPRPAQVAGTEVPLRVLTRSGALAQLPAVIDSVGPVTSPVLLHDGVTKTVASRSVLEQVRSLLPAARTVTEAVVAAGPHGVVLDEGTVAHAVAAAHGSDLVLAIGSGTVCDLAKQVGAHLDVPVVLVQTAASVNGYSDSLSVLVRGGAKRTLPTCWPHTLVIDLDVLADAPARLTRSGVGDAVAIWCAPADWYLACTTGLDPTPYHAGAVDAVVECADRLRDIDPASPAGLAAVTDTLTVGGLSIGVTGTTATLSGTEHLVSHLLDMAAMARGEEHDLHGAQVGVASVLSAALWECALEEIRLGGLDIAASGPPPDLQERVRDTWAEVDPSGTVGRECLTAVRRKSITWGEQVASGALPGVWRQWPVHEAAIRSLVRSPEQIARTLARWGAATRFSELTPTVDAERVRWVLRALPLMRDRVTLSDVLFFAGRWDDELIERILDRAAVAGGGL